MSVPDHDAAARERVLNRRRDDLSGPVRHFLPPSQRLEESAPAADGWAWLQWRFNRLRCMSAAEVSHRVARAVAVRAERAGIVRRGVVPEPKLGIEPQPWVKADAKVDAARYLAAAERIVAGRLDVFALPDLPVGVAPWWNRDPKTGVEAPLAFGKLLDYRDARRVGDIKYLWELNRHLHLVRLAQAYALSGDERYAVVLGLHLTTWFADCRYLIGPNWSSALEVAIRLINWSAAWQLLGGATSRVFEDDEGQRFRRQWLEAIFRHAQFISGYFSRYSSANNHLLGEAAALCVAALTWPYWPHSRDWLAKGREILEREALRQNAPDGVNREQAVCYQQFVLDLLLIPLLAAKANGCSFSAAYAARIEAMLEYLASIMDAGGNVPAFGDSDDGRVVSLAAGGGEDNYRSLLATGALLFRRPEFKAKAGTLDDKTRWLLGGNADAAFRALEANKARLPVRRCFPSGGYYVLGSDFETENEIRMVADAGPLGYQTIAAHGHADALSFTLSVGGTEFLIDPGTFAYHTRRSWREYFRGTAAHNTVRVDGVDQSVPGGNFMWLAKANARCNRWSCSPERDFFEGWHDGYLRLDDPVLHGRSIVFDKRARSFVIVDRLEMLAAHDIELMFHCSERCEVTRIARYYYMLSQHGRTVTLRLPALKPASAGVLSGSFAPIGGWVSRRLDEKTPGATIVWRARIAGPRTLRTYIDC